MLKAARRRATRWSGEAAPATDSTGLIPRWGAVVHAVRPRQFVKNGLVFAAFLFTVDLAWTPARPQSWLPLVGRCVVAFTGLCALSAAGYLFNDLRDVAADRVHPIKRARPLAAGTLAPGTARGMAAVLLLFGLLLGACLGGRVLAALTAYTLLTATYTLVLKKAPLVDVASIAAGFVLRAVVGALAIDVPISPWLYVCTFAGALLLAVDKRRQELSLLGAAAGRHRRSLSTYTPGVLDAISCVTALLVIGVYIAYAITAARLPHNHVMVATVPFVVVGVARYQFLVFQRGEGGSPEEILLRDRLLCCCLVAWLMSAGVLLAVNRQ